MVLMIKYMNAWPKQFDYALFLQRKNWHADGFFYWLLGRTHLIPSMWVRSRTRAIIRTELRNRGFPTAHHNISFCSSSECTPYLKRWIIDVIGMIKCHVRFFAKYLACTTMVVQIGRLNWRLKQMNAAKNTRDFKVEWFVDVAPELDAIASASLL